MSKSLERVRAKAYEAQSRRCFYCEAEMWTKSSQEFGQNFGLNQDQVGRFQCTAEHLVARRDGRTNSQENIVAACLHCNGRRHRFKAPPDATQYKTIVTAELRSGRWHRKWAFEKGVLYRRDLALSATPAAHK